jgi:hypothetical protein
MVRGEFTVHMLNDAGKVKATNIAATLSACLDMLEAECGTDGREMSIVRTKLEEAGFFAKKAMAKRPENQQ